MIMFASVHRVLLGIFTSLFTACVANDCVLPVPKSLDLFHSMADTPSQELSRTTTPDYSQCVSQCCSYSNGLCNVAVFKPPPWPVPAEPNCILHHCDVMKECYVPSDDGDEIFADAKTVSSTISKTLTHPPSSLHHPKGGKVPVSTQQTDVGPMEGTSALRGTDADDEDIVPSNKTTPLINTNITSSAQGQKRQNTSISKTTSKPNNEPSSQSSFTSSSVAKVSHETTNFDRSMQASTANQSVQTSTANQSVQTSTANQSTPTDDTSSSHAVATVAKVDDTVTLSSHTDKNKTRDTLTKSLVNTPTPVTNIKNSSTGGSMNMFSITLQTTRKSAPTPSPQNSTNITATTLHSGPSFRVLTTARKSFEIKNESNSAHAAHTTLATPERSPNPKSTLTRNPLRNQTTLVKERRKGLTMVTRTPLSTQRITQSTTTKAARQSLTKKTVSSTVGAGRPAGRTTPEITTIDGRESVGNAKTETPGTLEANDIAQASPAGEERTVGTTAGLIAALTIGCVFFLIISLVFARKLFDGWKKRHYAKIERDYLIEGMYDE